MNLKAVGQRFLRQPISGQGQHIDPLDGSIERPDPREWGRHQRAAFTSPEMDVFRECLRLPDVAGVRTAVLDDLSRHYGLTAEECLQRCLHWEELSVREWKARDRDNEDGLLDFYQSTTSWSFDLLWFAYLQSEGFAFPISVMIVRFLARRVATGRILDFGSGVGATGQLFTRLGYEAHLADVSTTLLEFARFRLERRDDEVTYLVLPQGELGSERYDAITAIDTLVHVPDFRATVERLHRALRPGGWLFTNFDVRSRSDDSAWHLYDDELALRMELQRVGFVQRATLDGITRCYQKVNPTGWPHRARGVRDAVLLESGPARMVHRLRWPTAAGLRRRWIRVRDRAARHRATP